MSDKLRQIQLCELDILKEIARICEKNNIDYWLAYGTMLGAVRHKGFIPWDDDIDIYMTMDGFRKFQKCCKKDLQPQYFLQTPESDPTMIWLYFKMRKNGTQMLEPGQVPAPDGSKHFGIWVDIFPLIEVADTDKNHEKQLEILRKLQYLRGQWIAVGAQKTVKNFIKKIINKTLRIYEKLLWSRVLSMGRKSSGLMLVIENEFYEGASESFVKKCHYSSKFFADGQEYTFEDFKFRGISDYDAYLTHAYSSDYMTPKRYNAHVEDYSQVIV